MGKVDRSVSSVGIVEATTLKDIVNKNWIVNHTYQNEFSVHICL